MTTRDHIRRRPSKVGQRVSILALTAAGLTVLSNVAPLNTGASGMTPTGRHMWAASSVASPPTSTRWVSVGVGTLWTRPGVMRTVDRLAISPPGLVRTWIAAMTVAQKQGLVGRIETQALYGTEVTVTSESKGWSHVVIPSQPTPRDRRGYPGWIPTWQLTSRHPKSTSSYATVTSPTTWVRSVSAAPRTTLILEVSYDTRLPVVGSNSSSIEVSLLDGRQGYVLRKNVSVHAVHAFLKATPGAVISESKKFLGLQYLWGGTSGFGFDCSGFTYSVFQVLGVTIPRDAAPQAAHGVPVQRQNLRPGDLVFFRNGSGVVVHVAIFIGLFDGVPSVIHSPNTGQAISIIPLSSWSNSSFAGARRYVP